MAKNTIKIKSYGNVQEEMISNGTAINPGMLLALTNATGGKTVSPHGTSGGNVVPIMFALEDELQGKTIDDAYAATAGTPIQVWIPQRGDIVKARLKYDQTIAVGDLLESDGAGELQKWVVDSTGDYLLTQIVGVALEAHTGVGSEGLDTTDFIQIRIV